MQIVTLDSENKQVLYKVAQTVTTPLSPVIEAQIEAMRAFYKTFTEKAGFAAPQVGISERIILVEQHLFDINSAAEDGEPVILINPEWEPLDEQQALDIEGCLSVPGQMGIVKRYTNVELKALRYCPQTKALTPIQRQYRREFASVLWQHEIDHLNGEVYVDKAKMIITEDEYAQLREALLQAGKIQEGMSLFDLGELYYKTKKASV